MRLLQRVGHDRVRDGAPADVGALVAEHLLRRAVELEDPPLGVHRDHGVEGGLEDRRLAGLAGAQLDLPLRALGQLALVGDAGRLTEKPHARLDEGGDVLPGVPAEDQELHAALPSVRTGGVLPHDLPQHLDLVRPLREREAEVDLGAHAQARRRLEKDPVDADVHREPLEGRGLGSRPRPGREADGDARLQPAGNVQQLFEPRVPQLRMHDAREDDVGAGASEGGLVGEGRGPAEDGDGGRARVAVGAQPADQVGGSRRIEAVDDDEAGAGASRQLHGRRAVGGDEALHRWSPQHRAAQLGA